MNVGTWSEILSIPLRFPRTSILSVVATNLISNCVLLKLCDYYYYNYSSNTGSKVCTYSEFGDGHEANDERAIIFTYRLLLFISLI